MDRARWMCALPTRCGWVRPTGGLHARTCQYLAQRPGPDGPGPRRGVYPSSGIIGRMAQVGREGLRGLDRGTEAKEKPVRLGGGQRGARLNKSRQHRTGASQNPASRAPFAEAVPPPRTFRTTMCCDYSVSRTRPEPRPRLRAPPLKGDRLSAFAHAEGLEGGAQVLLYGGLREEQTPRDLGVG